MMQYCKPIVIGDLRVLERALEVIGAKDKVNTSGNIRGRRGRLGARAFRCWIRKM